MPYKYASKYDKEKMARAVAQSAGISFKKSIMICNLIRKKKLSDARKRLEEVIAEKKAVPFTRFNDGVGHRSNISGPGRYPKKAALEFIRLLDVVEANAQSKGLNTSDLVIESICANKAGKQFHYGRQRGRKMKRTHVEICVVEGVKEAKKEKGKGKQKEKEVKKE